MIGNNTKRTPLAFLRHSRTQPIHSELIIYDNMFKLVLSIRRLICVATSSVDFKFYLDIAICGPKTKCNFTIKVRLLSCRKPG